MLTIPVPAEPFQRVSVVLAEQNCVITLRQIGSRLFAALEVDGETVFDGSLVCDRQPIPAHAVGGFSGKLMVADTKGREHPQYEGLGDRFVLCYLTDDEVASL